MRYFCGESAGFLGLGKCMETRLCGQCYRCRKHGHCSCLTFRQEQGMRREVSCGDSGGGNGVCTSTSIDEWGRCSSHPAAVWEQNALHQARLDSGGITKKAAINRKQKLGDALHKANVARLNALIKQAEKDIGNNKNVAEAQKTLSKARKELEAVQGMGCSILVFLLISLSMLSTLYGAASLHLI